MRAASKTRIQASIEKFANERLEDWRNNLKYPKPPSWFAFFQILCSYSHVKSHGDAPVQQRNVCSALRCRSKVADDCQKMGFSSGISEEQEAVRMKMKWKQVR